MASRNSAFSRQIPAFEDVPDDSVQENGSQNSAAESAGQEIEKSSRKLSGFADPTWWDTIDEETGLTQREKKKRWAKKMYDEGRLGGRQPGAGRPKKNRSVAEVVTEKASEPRNADAIARELLQMATQHRSPSVKLGAIDRINKFEQDLERNMRDDEKELLKLSGHSLDQALADALAEHGIEYDYDLPDSEVEEIDE